MGNYLDYKAKAQAHFEAMQYPQWKRLGLIQYNKPTLDGTEVKAQIQSEIDILGLDQLSQDQADAFYDRMNQRQYGVDPKFIALTESQSNFSKFYHIKKNQIVDQPIHIQFDLSDIATLADQHLIYAERGAEMTLILEYQGQDLAREKASEYHIGLIKVIAEENARIKVYVIQTLAESKIHVMNAVAECGRDARVSFYNVTLGGAIVLSDYRTFLMGDHSSADIESVYLGGSDNKLDLSYNIQHYGKMTDSCIDVNGALSGRAKKVFRGDLYFHRGSRASTGKETEFVILLDKNVKADSIPALFCDEDDVSGEHAANAGSVDENKLFYLMNRGFSESQAKKLIIRASFSGILDHLPLEELTQRLEKELEGKLVHV